MNPSERIVMSENPVAQVVTAIVIGAAYIVAVDYVGSKMISGARKIRPALHVPKLSKVKP